MRVEGEYINVNDLYGSVTDGSGGKTKGMSYNSSKARYAEINGVVKYDHWITVLEALDNTDISSKGGYITDLLEVTSYGTDYRDVKHQMKDSGDLSFSKTYISENTSTTSTVSHDITITQVKTGKSITVTLTQAKAEEVKYTLEHTLNVGTPSAKGGWVQVSVSWTRYKNGSYYDSGTAYPSISGYASVDGAYASGSEVYIPNAGTDTSQPTAYTITSYSFTVDGEEYEESASKRIYLGYNYITDTSTEYSVSCGSASVTSIANTGGTFSFTATCQSRETTTYYSGSVVTGSWSNASATVGYSNGVSSVSPTSFTGSTTITATVGENIGDSRNPRVTVTASDGTSGYAQVPQDAVSYTFTSYTLAYIGASGGDMSLTLISLRNESPWAISTSDISVSGLTDASVKSVTHLGDGEYAVVINVPQNTSSSSRSFTVTAVQPTSGETYTWTATQSGATVAKKKVATVLHAEFPDSGYLSVSYTVYFSATNTSSYSGGTISNVYIQLNTKSDGTGTVISQLKLYDSLTVSSGQLSETLEGSLINNTGSSLIYVLVYYDNVVQAAIIPMMSPDMNV